MAGDDPNRASVEALQRAVNDTAAKISFLWTSFIALAAYLLIATASIKHRDLFLGASIKLPILGVELPVAGYFAVAPIVFLIFHFYLVLQLNGLSRKVADYNRRLKSAVTDTDDLRLMRHQLDDFPLLQLLVGFGKEPGERGNAALQILISWITIAIIPLFVLLQMQVVFLPYHLTLVTWLQRACVVVDIVIICYFWLAICSTALPESRTFAPPMILVAAFGAAAIVLFSVCLATYPGEFIYRNFVARTLDLTTGMVLRDPAKSLTRYLFEGDVNDATGQPDSLFSNRLILPGEIFYDDEKHRPTQLSGSLRGRDLRSGVFQRADLREADFNGANLVEASFVQAKLQGANFGCPNRIEIALNGRIERQLNPELCTDLRGADLGEAFLQGTNFDHAKLQGSRFVKAMLQGSSLVDANLTASTLSYARLEGASLSGAKAIGGSFLWAQAQGVDFTEADLSAASFPRTQLQGAILGSADISNAAFNQANLYRAFIDKDDLKKALVTRVRADNRFPKLALAKEDAPEKLDQTGYDRLLARAPEGVTGETRDLIIKRLKSLDPSKPADEDQFVSDKGLSWDKEKNDAIRKARFAKLAETMCDGANAPFDARGFIYNGRILAAEMEGGQLIAKLRDVAHCPGAQGLNESDFREMMRLEAEAREFREN